jgi:hypothetical protein
MRHLVSWLFVAAGAMGAEVTFYRDVVPVLHKHCQGCHRPGEAAPFSMMDYASARPWAKAMKSAVLAKRMPPWFADEATGKFRNDPSLSGTEIAAITSWADGGAVEGKKSDAPPAVRFVEGWNIGKPDVEIAMPREYAVPAQGTIEYQYVVAPTGFTEDKWVKAVEVRPGNRELVHHIIAFVRPPGSRWLAAAPKDRPGTRAEDNMGSLPVEEMPEFLLSYTPGRPPAALEEGQARLIRAGSDIVFQLHYTANGKPGVDRSKVGLIFANTAPRERVATLPIANRTFAIPPGADNYRVEAAARVNAPARLLRMIPHMHLRGKAFEFALREKSGDLKTLLRVPRYDFNWQNAYELAEPPELREGQRIEIAGWYDNSPNNKWNPDPTQTVRWGDQSWEEMMLGYVDLAMSPGQEPKTTIANVAARPAASAATGGTVKEKFYGTWKLVSYDRVYNDGRVTYPFGEKVVGRIYYEKSGRMGAQLMRPGRKTSQPMASSAALRDLGYDDMKAVLNGFISYFGTFDVDEGAKEVVHHVESCLIPSWEGTDLRRTYEFNGNRMTLSVKYSDGAGRLVWERLPDAP